MTTALIIGFFGFGVPIFAYDQVNSGTSVTLPAGQTVDQNYFAGGETVIVSGTVNGDAYIAGGNVIVDGTVNGDLLIAGGNVTFTGNVLQDMRIIGGNVQISGRVERNMTIAGGDVNLDRSGSIGGSVAMASGNAQIFSPVGQTITAASGTLTIGNTVGSDVQTAVGNLNLTSDARINGGLTYVSQNPISIPENAVIAGQVIHQIPPSGRQTADPAQTREFLSGANAVFSLIWFLSNLAMGLILLWLLPNFVRKTSQVLIKRPWVSLLIGFLVLIGTPLVILLLFASVALIPLALIILVLYLFVLYISHLFVSLAVGEKVLVWFNRNPNLIGAFLIGLIIYSVAWMIPFLGGLVTFIGGLLGLGALLISQRETYQGLRLKKLV
jgi:hypothetical protein